MEFNCYSCGSPNTIRKINFNAELDKEFTRLIGFYVREYGENEACASISKCFINAYNSAFGHKTIKVTVSTEQKTDLGPAHINIPSDAQFPKNIQLGPGKVEAMPLSQGFFSKDCLDVINFKDGIQTKMNQEDVIRYMRANDVHPAMIAGLGANGGEAFYFIDPSQVKELILDLLYFYEKYLREIKE